MANVDEQGQHPLRRGDSITGRVVHRINGMLEVPAKQAAAMFGVDRVFSVATQWLRLTAFALRTLKAYDFVTCAAKVVKIDAFLGKLSATRYVQAYSIWQITRRTRKWLYLQDLLQTYNKGIPWRKSKRTLIDFVFKLYVLASDLNDIGHYLHYVKLLDNPALQLQLRTLNANLYFFECVVWLLMNIYDYLHQREDANRKREKLLFILKYVMDVLISHNDFSRCIYKLEPKLISVLGLLSSLLSLYMAWR